MSRLPFLICLIAIVSCTEISFKEPQPKGIKKLKDFPSSLHGLYLIPDDSTRNMDTLEITKQGYRFSGNPEKNDWFNRGNLSDSLVLKKYKGYFFLNFYVEKQWVIRTFKQEKNGNITLFEVTLSDEKTMQSFNTKFHPEILKEDSDTFYKIDPSPRDLLEFIKTYAIAQPSLKKIK